VLGFFDLFTRLEFLDFRRLDLAEYNRRQGLALTLEDLDREMYVISRGQAYIGYYGYRVLAWALPAFWPLIPLLYFPGISWAGEWVYGVIARNRLALLHCDSHCPTTPSGVGISRVLAPMHDRPQPLRYALLISGFCVVAATSFYYRLEFYPVLTAWHLYAGLSTSGEITYFKAVGHQASGATVPVRVGEYVGALRYDGRETRILKQCFEGLGNERGGIVTRDLESCKKYLAVSGSIYNEQAPPDKKITHLEMQERAWNFRSDPSDSEYGKVKNHVTIEIERSSASAKKET
jgi:hypothetical protein